MFSIVLPIDTNRLKQFKHTKQVYDTFPQEKEFILPTRSYEAVRKYLEDNDLMANVTLIPYEHEIGFNPAKALNIGVRNANYENIIISSPEVKPTTQVLEQLTEYAGQNVVCQVFDQGEQGDLKTLVCKGYRDDMPAMYFLAMFQKSDIEKINGWDEDFMKGYAYEDNDFGARWVRAGLPFVMVDEIQALHQYHPRAETIPGGITVNLNTYNENTNKGVTFCANGLKPPDMVK